MVENLSSDYVHNVSHTQWSSIDGLSPIISLLIDETISDILVNGPNEIFIERGGKLLHTECRFPDEASLHQLAINIAVAVGRNIDPNRPLVDARLPDGSRVNIIAPPLSIDGTIISIRKFPRNKITIDEMLRLGCISGSLAEFIKVAGRCRMNIIISGGTGSGKTTLLNAVSQYINAAERVVTIEDAIELQLQQPHVVRLETVPARLASGANNEITIRDLVRNALRMRPDRIIVGEVRGSEAFDMLQAMNTGHEGSLTTIHANHPRDAISRLENMVSMSNLNIPLKSIRSQIASALHLIIQTSRMSDGVRRITYVTEIAGMEGDTMTMNDLFTFNNKGEDKNGILMGDFTWSGIMPRFLKRAAYYGELERLSKALGIKTPKV
jgi:pilus assembly protein CpaF